MSDEFEVSAENGVPACPACGEEMELSEKVDIDKHTYIGESWDCYNKTCDLHYVPKE